MDEEMKILLVCGNGASSGYLAMQTKKAAKKRKLNVFVQAFPISNVASSIESFDYVLVGPHHAFDMDFIESLCKEHNKKCALISKKVYSELDGSAILDMCENLKKEG